MNGYAATKVSLSHEEKLSLMEEKTLSDVESESGRADLDTRFTARRGLAEAMALLQGLRVSSWRASISRTAVFILPSFIQNRFARERLRNERLGPTAYLDGLRGLAALFVFFCHYFYTAFAIAEGWGHNGANYEIWKWPFIRLLVSGPSMVCVFFVVSGYALSLKPLKQARSRSFDGFTTTMSSFIFRRGFRLYLPTAVSTFMVFILLRLGVYEWTRDFANDRTYMKNIVEHHPLLIGTTYEQFKHWLWEMFSFVHLFGWEKFGGSTGYDVHLWTIPVEYRCSMMLFLAIIGTSRLRTGWRFFCVFLFAWFCLRNDRWEMVLFLSGMALAEMDLIRGAHNPPSQSPPSSQQSVLPFDEETPAPRRRSAKKVVLVLVSVLALYFMSEPDLGPEGVPGWEFLSTFIPEWFSDKYRYYQMFGSIMFVFCVARVPAWQNVFNSAFVQYFGRISYAIYLMHGPVTHTIGFTVQRLAWGVTGLEGAAYNFGFILAGIVNIPLVIWAADVFWRAVDAPIVKFSKWLEGKLLIQES